MRSYSFTHLTGNTLEVTWQTKQTNQKNKLSHCGLVISAPAWDGTGCEFDSWQCRIYIPCSLSLRLLGSLRGSLGTRDVRPRGLASRPKNLASASASWVLASASWVLTSSLEASRGLQPSRSGTECDRKWINNEFPEVSHTAANRKLDLHLA